MMLRRLLGGAGDKTPLQRHLPEEDTNDNVRERIHNKLMMNRELKDSRLVAGQLNRPGSSGSGSFTTAAPGMQKRSNSEGSSNRIERPSRDLGASSPETEAWEHESTDYDGFLYEEEGQSKYYEDVDGYLTQQNRKFNQLIDKNLNYVAHNNLTDVYKEPGSNSSPRDMFDSNQRYGDDDYNLLLMDKFIMSLDENNKIKLYQKLSQELGPSNKMMHYSLLNEDKNYIKTLTVFEKCELVMILMIKLNFLLIKYSVPITKKLYNKFVTNQMFLLNNDNFNRLLNLIIKLLNNLENNYYSTKDGDIDSLDADIREQIDQLDQWNLNQGSRFGVINPVKVVGIIYNYYRGGANDLDLLNAAEEFVNQM